MSFTHKQVQSVTIDSGGGPVVTRQSITADQEINIDVQVPASTADYLVNIAFAIADLKSFFLTSDGALTLETNSSSAPQETKTLVAEIPLQWYTGGQIAALFSGNVTKFYFTNALSTVANVKIRALVDPTP